MITLFLLIYIFGVICGFTLIILIAMGYCKLGNKIIIEYQNGIQKWETKTDN